MILFGNYIPFGIFIQKELKFNTMKLEKYNLYLILLLVIGFFHIGVPSSQGFNNQSKTDTVVTLKVSGVCGMCKSRIEDKSQGTGLIRANWSVSDHLLTLEYDTKKYDLNAAIDRILASGHDVDSLVADQKAYEQLPACCHYKDEKNPHLQPSKQGRRVIGAIMHENNRGDLSPITNANVRWLEDLKVQANSDSDGIFSIPYDEDYKKLIVSHAGHNPDTILVTNPEEMILVTAKGNTLTEVTVTARRNSSYISALTPNRLEVLTSQELFKAACCDLSESFETNASVDVVNSDAVTGSKQIQMLGLSGIYTQLTVENLPGPRGLATPLGMGSIAGSWIDAIQISKGVGSVANGFENMTGQINVELKKPESSERLFFNLYGNDMGRTDINLNLAHKINDKWSTGFLLHDNFMFNKHLNFSNNGFRDIPAGNIFSGINRWKYENGHGLLVQFGLKYFKDDRTGGQIGFDPQQDRNTQNKYGIGFDINRYEIFSKIGYIFPSNRHRSIGLQISGSVFDQDSYFGARDYMAKQRGLYANLIYQDIIGSVEHKYRVGLSSQYDKYDETYMISNYNRTEIVPGAFAEYTYSPAAHFDIVAGIRGDYNNLYGWFATPRLHARYQPFTGTTIRLSAGRGQRTANILAENTAALASSRILRIDSDLNAGNGAYGLQPEISWNTGLTLDQSFYIFSRSASISAEFYRSDFVNQVVVDYENPRELVFYNLKNDSYANSFQAEFRFMPLSRFEFRTAYRLFDVQTHFRNAEAKLARPLVARHRGFVNLSHHTADHGWFFDYTLNITGQKRLPYTASNPSDYQMPDYSRSYTTMNAQITKRIGTARPIDIYVGGENLTNFFQKDPILAADQPFGNYFDTSMLWGPLSGRMIYAGLRFSIK